jgi:hypothetical protein
MLGARRSIISGKKQLSLISFLEKSSSRTPPTYEGALFSKKNRRALFSGHYLVRLVLGSGGGGWGLISEKAY